MWRGMGQQLIWCAETSTLTSTTRCAPPSNLAALLIHRLVDADLEFTLATGRAPLGSYQGSKGTRPSRIHTLMVDTLLAAHPHAAEVLPRGTIPGHTLVHFDLHLRGASRRVVKSCAPSPLLAPREEHERLLFVDRLLEPLEAGWRAPLATGGVDSVWAY